MSEVGDLWDPPSTLTPSRNPGAYLLLHGGYLKELLEPASVSPLDLFNPRPAVPSLFPAKRLRVSLLTLSGLRLTALGARPGML